MDAPNLSEATLGAVPEEVRAYIRWLEAQVSALQQQVQTLQAAVAASQARAQQHSGTSSRPPSSDPPDAPNRSTRRPTGRARGGQPGHAGHQRELVATDQVKDVVVHRPVACPSCQTPLPPDLSPVGGPTRQQ